MVRYFLILLCLTAPLFPNDYEDEEDEYYEPTEVSYNGLRLLCNFGCGAPGLDFDARCIQYLCNEWLQIPLRPWWVKPDNYYVEALDLKPWEYRRLMDSEYNSAKINDFVSL